MLGRHNDANFSSMNLSMCALLITQPVLRKKHDSIPARHCLTIKKLQAALGLREFIFGEAVTPQGGSFTGVRICSHLEVKDLHIRGTYGKPVGRDTCVSSVYGDENYKKGTTSITVGLQLSFSLLLAPPDS
jgi:hypothetical protein